MKPSKAQLSSCLCLECLFQYQPIQIASITIKGMEGNKMCQALGWMELQMIGCKVSNLRQSRSNEVYFSYILEGLYPKYLHLRFLENKLF